MSDFRADGALALEWVASYLDRVGELPVLSQVEPGAIRRGAARVGARRARAVLGRARRPRSILVPGLTHWQSPRFFAYFATTGAEPGVLAELLDRRPQPGRDPLADVACAPGARGGDGRLAAAARRAPRGLPGSHRGHGFDGGAHRGDRRPLAPAGPPRPRLLGARALGGREGRASARPRAAEGARPTTRSGCGRTSSARRTRASSSRRSGRPA